MTPPHVHISLDVLFKTGILPSNTVGEPGAHGAGVAGIHGIGVRTPIAAAVAEATSGLAIDEHMPNGTTLTMGLLSIIVAAGCELVSTRFSGSTNRVDGASPNVQAVPAPLQTCIAIAELISFLTIC